MLTAVGMWQAELARAIRDKFGVAWSPDQVPFMFPPKPELGDAATPVGFALAKLLKRPPVAISAELATVPLPGVREIGAAGGYLNLYLDRGRALCDLLAGRFVPTAAPGKVIVEHTNINPNKAAHVGHLRNAVLGDTLVKCLRHLGRTVEVQNYIDDTGVQVADVVVGFQRILDWDLDRVRLAIALSKDRDSGDKPFDQQCWDLYARVGPWYAESEDRKAARLDTLHLMEAGGNETAAMAALVAEEMVRCHLRTMDRLGVRYAVLPHESDILKSGFWASCLEKLKAAGAVHLVPADSEDKNRGCWVMALTETADFKGMSDADKIIVRSNGTVTYVGKDMAYQLWKFGLLGRDFRYRPFENPLYPIWRTDSASVILASEARPESDSGQAGMTPGTALQGPSISHSGERSESRIPSPPKGDSHGGAPSFGGGDTVINVIDARQSYLQKIVKEGLRQMGYDAQADRSIHFAYEMVALSQKTAAEFERAGQIRLSEEDRARPYVEMSGRKGLGVQADALLDILAEKAGAEIRKREPDLPEGEIAGRARDLAVGALRYYMVKYGRTAVIPFDFEQALAFEGDTGPYLQYACVRAEAILRKAAALGIAIPDPSDPAQVEELAAAFDEEGWAVLGAFLRVPMQVRAAVEGLDLNLVARQLYEAAQAFHAYYHHFPVIQEPDDLKRRARLLTVACFARLLRQNLDQLLGIPVPERM
jgi:arginyl-tRNA synthetase